ncbi:hypothetical protein [Lacticaseibacillus camelliae]|uniref:Uncharacterized protein n=1 Tax=Lacticaseibacillus camelliae DSM 22697 = JCM 13995 TaxID=1423730 RepID=A0A0R2FIK8_9LACO|nr:hypothetical protein [Lacticaseibacillus camelliae]KRN24855.1 hypothetical protein FC75_GL001070 [Lacticaseibacillus camelliae DSM 22697 = JCM 13995]
MKRSSKIAIWVIAVVVIIAGAAWFVHQDSQAPTKETQKSSQVKKARQKKAESKSAATKATSKQSSSASSSSSAAGSSAVASVAKAAPQQLDQVKANAGGTYSDITATAKGDSTVVYTMTLAKALDKNTDKSALKTVLVKALLPAINQARKTQPGVVLKVVLKNPDSTEVVNDVISQQDIDEEVQ